MNVLEYLATHNYKADLNIPTPQEQIFKFAIKENEDDCDKQKIQRIIRVREKAEVKR